MSARHVVVVGAGFGGLRTARELDSTSLRVTLVDRRGYHLFTPLAYQVATAGLNASEVAVPIRWVFRHSANVRTVLGEVTDVDLDRRRLALAGNRSLDYDYLVLAAGAESHYFGNDAEWARHLLTLDDLDSSLRMREQILLAFEAAEIETHPGARARLLTFAVIGGGPTGVELAGSLAELGRDVLAREYRNFDRGDVRVVLFEAQDRLLPSFPPRSSRAALKQLQGLDVEVRLNTPINRVERDLVGYDGGELAANTICWGSGVRAARLAEAIPSERRDSRLVVDETLCLPGRPEVFAIGDLASRETEDGGALPGLAPVALQQGKAVAEAILCDERGAPRQPFVYRDRGLMATIGKRRAVAKLGRLQMSGSLAWLVWVVVHVTYLIGFRNRVLVLLDWAFCYLGFGNRRGARIVSREIDPGRLHHGAESWKAP